MVLGGWAFPATPGLGWFNGTARLFHAARWPVRFDVGSAFQPLEPRDLLTLLGHYPAQSRNAIEQFDHQGFQISRRNCINVGGTGMSPGNQNRGHPHSKKRGPRPWFCPYYFDYGTKNASKTVILA